MFYRHTLLETDGQMIEQCNYHLYYVFSGLHDANWHASWQVQ